MDLLEPVEKIKGVGPVVAKELARQGIVTIYDLIDYLPRRYDDFSELSPAGQLKPGPVTVKAKIKQVTSRRGLRGFHITEAVASDLSGNVRLIWFNQPYRKSSIKTDQDYFISGVFELNHQRFSLINPSVELASEFPINTARIIPRYPETKTLKSHQIRRALREVMPFIKNLPETLPDWLIKRQDLMSRSRALENIHFPTSSTEFESAKRRLGFEEVFELTLAALLNKKEASKDKGLKVKFDPKLAKDFVAQLPFTLTDAQRKSIWQMYLDMQKPMPMNRLLEGDVGSGKTVVATMAALMALKHGLQVALMAPTEILARQHADTIYKLLEPLGLNDKVGLLIGGLSPKAKLEAQKNIKNGKIQFIIGTHALVQQKVGMNKLGLIIVDEQHRFGVEQRKKLQAKAGHMPHVLHMSATPIPRSLALTLFGEVDISTIDTKPKNRKPIVTKICTSHERLRVYEKAKSEIKNGRQVFVVCPLISESEVLPSKSVEQVYKDLSQGPFKHNKIGLLHGKLKADEKDRVMQQFARGEIEVLVTTTVIEVGVDVPNASVMIIEDAERFGLAQIHQLRGRVGRSEHQGHAYLMIDQASQPSQRLRALESSNDGFKLAQLDLEIRGAGAIYGTLQHGALDLRVAKLTDTKLITQARSAAQEFINKGENLLKYKKLNNKVSDLRKITNLN